MNRFLLCTILTLIFFNSGYSQLLKRDIEDFSVKGSVKSFNEFTYSDIYKSGTIVKGHLSKDDFVEGEKGYKHNFFVLFDIDGNKLQYNEYNYPTQPWNTIQYIYTNKKLVLEVEKMVFSDGKIDIKTVYKYDKEGNKTEKIMDRNGAFFKKTVFKNLKTANGLEVEETVYDNDGSILEKSLKEYNLKGIEIKAIEYNSDGEEKSAYSYTYNDEGVEIESIYRWNDDSGKGSTKWVKEYDNNGKIICVKTYSFDKLFNIRKYKYNEDGLILNWITESPNGQKIYERDYVYDNKKKVQETVEDKEGTKKYKYNDNLNIVEYEESGNVYKYDYTYDKKGNWTKIIEYRNTIPVLRKERSITYYDAVNPVTKVQ
jgi:hypothetical protein